MKKLFLAMMAVAAISFVGCKPQNTPEEPKPDVKLFYEIKFTGKMTDYVKLNLRYVNIPDSNDILVEENIISDWTPEDYTVKQGVAAVYGFEPSIRATELFKQTFMEEAKHKTMVESNSSLVIGMGYKNTLPDGSVEVEYSKKYTIRLSDIPFDESKRDAMISTLENAAEPTAYCFLWDEKDNLNNPEITNFWYRH